MDRNWVRLGQALQAARKAKGVKQEQLADSLGVGRSTIQMIERGHAYVKIQPTHRAFARYLGWAPGSIEAVLADSQPTLTEPTPAPAPAPAEPASPPVEPEGSATPTAAGTKLPLRIVDELSDEGPLLDATVIHLGDDARMVVVVKGKPDASPEEIRRNLEAWRRTQPHLAALSQPLPDEDETAANGS